MPVFSWMDDGDGDCDALIAAAGIDDHRQLTAAHAGIGTGGRLGNGPVAHLAAVEFQHGGTDVGTVIPPQALLGDRRVVPDLRIQHLADIRQVASIGKVVNIGNVQQASVRQTPPQAPPFSSVRSRITSPFFLMETMLVW